jgi:hypothetical protein
MRALLVSICCLSLVGLAGAAQQQQDQADQQHKKKGQGGQGGATPKQQVVTPKYYKKGSTGNPGPTPTPGGYGKSKFKSTTGQQGQQFQQGQGTKSKFSKQSNQLPAVQKNQNLKVQNYQVKKFNLATNQVNTKYKTVNFNANYKIAGAHNWKGAKYQVFVNYHPVWHDQFWWHNHHNHIVLIFGGWYFWDAGYWYPAWGYDPASVYYFDGPIYASSPEMDPGQVVANVQSALQEQGYYQGEVDGILGPQTRAALADYQSAQGLEPTGAVDEPTLESLGMA